MCLTHVQAKAISYSQRFVIIETMHCIELGPILVFWQNQSSYLRRVAVSHIMVNWVESDVASLLVWLSVPLST